jgi:large subunit ribosomal protein L35
LQKTMPKQKTHSGAKKRFKVTATGKLLRRRANRTTPPGHLVKATQAKRKRARQDRPVARSDEKTVRKMLGGWR